MAAPDDTDRGLVVTLGRLEVDIPRSLGYFGAVALAVSCGVIDPPLGVFIAAVPLLKLLGKSDLPWPLRFVSQVVDGAAQPVGGDAEGTVRVRDPNEQAAADIATAEAAERGEQRKAARSSRRTGAAVGGGQAGPRQRHAVRRA
jgi:hypothetical protein